MHNQYLPAFGIACLMLDGHRFMKLFHRRPASGAEQASRFTRQHNHFDDGDLRSDLFRDNIGMFRTQAR